MAMNVPKITATKTTPILRIVPAVAEPPRGEAVLYVVKKYRNTTYWLTAFGLAEVIVAVWSR